MSFNDLFIVSWVSLKLNIPLHIIQKFVIIIIIIIIITFVEQHNFMRSMSIVVVSIKCRQHGHGLYNNR